MNEDMPEVAEDPAADVVLTVVLAYTRCHCYFEL